ncbi:spermatogenesis-associated protein 31-like [Grammomys surdaster]|uniref:spermatogenesis-associated protein 31-like n=1 Tax=Grammomys surdaster TaxID=491861 RepID=UPI00109FB2C7|nr:spermatogenesis-associated protein 31-like [Grammomys surdaster]
MENLPSLLESIYTTWLSLSSTIWAMDMILAFVCGLGLYLLFLPFLESRLSSTPSNIKFTRKPQIQMTWQSQYKKKFRNHCRNDAKAWGECLKKLKEKEKDELFLEEMSPGHHLNSLGNIFNLPSAKQDSTTLSPFWNLKEKSEEQVTTQKLSYPKISGDHFQQKYDQLFWGLPSLHSESLVAAAWIPQTTSTLSSPFFLFNVISSVYPIQLQDKMSPMLPHTHPLSYLDLQPPPLILSPLEFQPPALNQVHFQSPLPVLLPSSLPYNRDFGTSYSQSQSKPQYLPTEINYRERPSMTQLESRLTLPLMVQKPQESYDILTPSPSQDWADSILPDNFPINCELREKLEQHIQKWLIQHQRNFPHKIQESGEVMELQNTVPENCQIRGKPGTSQALVSTGEHSKEGQKVRFQLEKESGKNLGPILGKISKDPIRGLEKTMVKVQGPNNLESGRISVRCPRNDSTHHIDKDLVNNLKAHLGTKSVQINQGLTPLSMRRSWLAVDNSFYDTDILVETRSLTSLRSSETSICSTEKLAFLSPETRQALEAHVVRFWVKHRWALPLKILKPIKLFKLKSIESLPVALCAQSSSTTSVHGTSPAVEVVRYLGKPCLRQMIIKDSSPSPGNLFLVSSPSCKRAMRRLPSGVDHEPSTALPTKSESGHLSETLMYNFIDTPSQSRSVLKKEIENQEVLLLPRRTSAQKPECHNLQAKVVSEFPHNVETELAGQPQIYTTAVLLPKRSRSMLLPVENLTSHVLGDIVVVEGGSGLVHQRPSTPKKSQIKMLAPTYQGEDTERESERKYEDRSQFTPIKEKKVNFGGQYYHILPKTTQVLTESPSQRRLSRFLQWIHPRKIIKGQECHPLKGTVQNQQRQLSKKPYMDNNDAEAQDLMTAVGQILEKKMMMQHQLCAPKFNQHREVPPVPTSQFSHGHMPVSYLEQRRPPSYPANSSCQRCSLQDRHIRNQLSQKSVQFSKRPQIPRNPSRLPPKAALNLVNSSHNRTIVPRIPNHHLCCPRHCALQRNVCRELRHSPVVFPNRKTY